jgi:hypothetical protein
MGVLTTFSVFDMLTAEIALLEFHLAEESWGESGQTLFLALMATL